MDSWAVAGDDIALVRHRWAAGLWLRQMPGPARVAHMEQHLAALAATDMTPSVAHLAFHAVNNHVIGYTLQEQAMASGWVHWCPTTWPAGLTKDGTNDRARPT